MKKNLTLLLVSMVTLCSMLSAQNMMDSTIAGYENTSTNFKKAFGNDLWYGNFPDSAFFVTDSMAFAGDYSLCFKDTLNALRKLDGTIDTKKAVYFSYFPIAGDTLFAGEYTLSQKVYLEENNTMKSFFTEIGAPVVASVEWDIENSPRGEWLTLESVIAIAEDIDVRADKGKAARLITRIPADTANADLQIMYIDDHQMMVKVEDTTSIGVYKEGNLFDESIYGFENSAIPATDGWYPQKNAGADHYDFTMDKAASGNYSLRLKVNQGDTDVPAKLKVQGLLSEGNSITLDSAVYDLYMKVFITDGSVINTVNTNYSANKDANKVIIPNPYTGIAWDLSQVETGKWVELHRVDTLPTFDRAKFTIQILAESLDNTTNDVEVYFDDIAAVFKEAYIPMPGLKASAALQDSVFKVDNPAVHFMVDNFVLGTEGKISYTLNGGTAMMHETTDSIQLSSLVDGDYEMIIELVDMNGTSLDPQVTDTLNFSVNLPSSVERNTVFNLDVYPNPANTQITITTAIGSQIQIFNLSGVEVRNYMQENNVSSISVAALKAGTYFVKVSNDHGSRVKLIQVR